MRVIKQGELPVEWWLRQEWICHRCGCVFRPEEGDPVSHGDDQRDGEWAATNCPTCGEPVTTSPRGRR